MASLQQFAQSASSCLKLSDNVILILRGIHGVHVALVSTEVEHTASNRLKAKAILHAFDGLYGVILPGEYSAQYTTSLV
jgi:hypothetical protein